MSYRWNGNLWNLWFFARFCRSCQNVSWPNQTNLFQILLRNSTWNMEINENDLRFQRLIYFQILSWNPKQPVWNGCLVISNHFPSKDSESSNWNNQKNGWWTLGKNLKTRAFDCSFCRRSQVLRWVGCCMVLETRQLLKLVSLGAFIRSFYQKYDHFLVTGILGGGVGDSQILFRLCFVKPVLFGGVLLENIFSPKHPWKIHGWSFFAESEVGYCALAMRHKCSGICPVKHVNAWNICSSTVSIFVFAYQGISLLVHSSVHQFAGHTKYVGHHMVFTPPNDTFWILHLHMAFFCSEIITNQISHMGKCVKPSNANRTSAVSNDLQGAVVLDPLDRSFGSLLHACTFANLRHLGPEKTYGSQLFCWKMFLKVPAETDFFRCLESGQGC